MNSGEEFTEQLRSLEINESLPHDYIASSENWHRLCLLKTLDPTPEIDRIFPCPVTSGTGNDMKLINEENEIFMDGIMDASKPKKLSSKPGVLSKTLSEMLSEGTRETQSGHFQAMLRTAEKAKKFKWPVEYKSIGNLQSAYEYTVASFSYQEIEESYKYNLRKTNQSLYISSKTKKLINGITRPTLLRTFNMKELPEYALRSLKLYQYKDLSSNLYSYLPKPPTYEDVKWPDATNLKKKAKQQARKINKSVAPIEISLLFVEVFVVNRENLIPDPHFDSINFASCKYRDDMSETENFIIELCSGGLSFHRNMYTAKMIQVESEIDLIEFFICYIRRKDPDFILSFESEKMGINYLIKRAQILGVPFHQHISRTLGTIGSKVIQMKLGSRLAGRMLISVWRIVRAEVRLHNYTFHTAVHEVLNIRTVEYPWDTLKKYYTQCKYLVYDHFLEKIYYSEKIIEYFEVFQRNIHLAQFFGVDLNSVFTRGSQFRVESLMKKLTYENDYLLLSAMTEQIRNQQVVKNIPLVVEPPKNLWTDPVVILDFQSLYPSIMIAYNLCFSTCLGKLDSAPYKRFGVTYMKREMFSDNEDVLITPNNIAFIKSSTRIGILPIMLHELLMSRIMIKNSLKNCLQDSPEYLALFTQQLGIKLMCNTTYGYTEAGISGRMPCLDIADSIVSLARRTLEAAISLVNSNEQWDGKVIYGDTDSLMVVLPGRTVEQAFQVGKEIAEAVTNANPQPIQLVLEKVGFPMITTAKRHYALLKYLTPESVPVFEAKGIHSVRKNSCPLASAILENSLKTLFSTRDVSALYDYLVKAWTSVYKGEIPLSSYVFSQEITLGTYTVPPPAARLVIQHMKSDPMKIPLAGEKVPYVVITGQPGAGLLENVESPLDFLASGSKLKYNYYITKHINHIINHTIGHIGVNVDKWFDRFTRPTMILHTSFKNQSNKSSAIDVYYNRAKCQICRIRSKLSICESCASNTQKQAFLVDSSLKGLEVEQNTMNEVCRTCSGNDKEVACCAIDCPVFNTRILLENELKVFIDMYRTIRDNN